MPSQVGTVFSQNSQPEEFHHPVELRHIKSISSSSSNPFADHQLVEMSHSLSNNPTTFRHSVANVGNSFGHFDNENSSAGRILTMNRLKTKEKEITVINNKVPGHICDIYCNECEIATKKSRTLLLSTGGDVIINSSFENCICNFPGNCTNRSSATASSASNSTSMCGSSSNSKNCHCHHRGSSSMGQKSNFSVKIPVPNLDFRTQRLVVNVIIENKKKISDDLNIISRNLSQLKESGWYYESMNYQDAQNLLLKSEPGTFLLRNSSDSRFLFSLSVQTDRGPTSVRINYVNGRFQLDADKKFSDVLPKVETVIGLLDHHVRTAQYTGQVWVEPSGKRYSQVVLTKPLKKNVPTLQHLSRIVLNNCLNSGQQLSSTRGTRSSSSSSTRSHSSSHSHEERPIIPPSIQKYLSDYPYKF